MSFLQKGSEALLFLNFQIRKGKNPISLKHEKRSKTYFNFFPIS